MTTYLCTCGTSAAKKLPRVPRYDAAWVKSIGGVEAAAAEIYATFRGASFKDGATDKNNLSAELHSLACMDVQSLDTVVLFTSETPDGQACALAVKQYLDAVRPGIVCRIEVIAGLQVVNAQQFRTAGVLNFTQAVIREIDRHGAAQCRLNPTGGFKSLVPYTVLIGMLKGVEATYIFEQSNALIHLPMMPVEFARSRMEPIRPLLERMQKETAIPWADYEAALSFADRDALAPLFEDLGEGQISLSPVGFLIWEELERPSALVPFLSRQALDDLLKIRAIDSCNPEEYLTRVARSPEQLAVGKHGSWSNGLFWLKPGPTVDRYLVSVEGWRLLVWRIVEHKKYDGMMDQNRQRDVGAGVMAERRSRYAPFVRMELYE